jgi:protein XRP2
LCNVSTLLYCQTEPVIESSKNVSFGCFSFSYLPLASQFVATKLSPWDNRWSEVYDFTPSPNGAKNFSFIDVTLEDSFPVKPLSAVGEWGW